MEREIQIYELKNIIPSKFSEFQKLTKGDPYYFDKWGTDSSQNSCLYYWFWSKDKTHKNRKRIVISEIDSLIRNSKDKGFFDRNDFDLYCSTSASAGSCGFAVMGRVLEYLNKAKYANHKFVYV